MSLAQYLDARTTVLPLGGSSPSQGLWQGTVDPMVVKQTPNTQVNARLTVQEACFESPCLEHKYDRSSSRLTSHHHLL